MLRLPCPSCSKKLNVRDEFAGKSVRCSGCGTLVRIPALAATPSFVPGSPPQPDQPASSEQDSASEVTRDGSGVREHTVPIPASSTAAPKNLIEFLAPAQSSDELGRL